MVSDSENLALLSISFLKNNVVDFVLKIRVWIVSNAFFLIKRKKESQLQASFFCRGALSYSWGPLT